MTFQKISEKEFKTLVAPLRLWQRLKVLSTQNAVTLRLKAIENGK
jgi:hypothetical protein